MYFPSEEERRYVLRKLLPQARRQGVFEELRGWSWHQPPVAPVHDGTRLAVSEVATKYCPTGRDVFQRRVMKVVVPPNRLMEEGRALHRVVAELIVAAKRLIYVHGPDCLAELEGLRSLPCPWLDEVRMSEEERAELKRKAGLLREYECRRIVERVQEVVTRQPYAGPDAVVGLALPVIVEQKLDGRFVGLSAHLSVDAFVFTELVLVDLKFGPREEFHRLATTGYALVLESLHEYPIDLGCVVYVNFRGDRVVVERDFHLIDDELRQAFLNERDEKARLVELEEDPGLPAVCYQWCPYLPVCVPGAKAGEEIRLERGGAARGSRRSGRRAAGEG